MSQSPPSILYCHCHMRMLSTEEIARRAEEATAKAQAALASLAE